MKTTLEIPDALFRRAKTVAAERGIPFRALNENLDKRAFYAAFRNATNSVFVAAKRCAFSSR